MSTAILTTYFTSLVRVMMIVHLIFVLQFLKCLFADLSSSLQKTMTTAKRGTQKTPETIPNAQ